MSEYPWNEVDITYNPALFTIFKSSPKILSANQIAASFDL